MALITYILIAIPVCLLAIILWLYFDYWKYKRKNHFILLILLFYPILSYAQYTDKVTTKKRNAERYSDRIELQGFQSCFRLFVKPSQSPLKPNQDAATLLVRNHARNGDKRTRITKQGVKD
ncbi:hypothetical protein ACJEEN_10050 [Bacteroides clarus]|uniref:hypothetical protein n=1 Tax=Bacteroides clarus TaxID=626929 RepID=UPI00397E1DF4